MLSSPFWTATIIVFVFTIGQFGETLYLPAGPFILHDLSSNQSSIQLILSAFLFGYGSSQIAWGPISDSFGRKPVILIGTALFSIGSGFAAISQNIDNLLIFFALAGVGMGSAGAMCRTILRDLYSGISLHKVMGVLGVSLVIVPVISPLLGSYLVTYYGWRFDFWLLAVLGIISFVIAAVCLKETNKHIAENHFSIKGILKSYKMVLTHKVFMGNMLCGLFNYATIMAYEVSIPFLMQDKLGLTTIEFGWAAIVPAFGFFAGSLLSNRVVGYLSPYKLIMLSFGLVFLSALGMFVPAALGHMSVLSLISPMMLYMLASGMIFASTSSEALMPFTRNIGAAAAVLGVFHNVGVSISNAITSYLSLQHQYTLSLVFIVLNILMVLVYFGLVLPEKFKKMVSS